MKNAEQKANKKQVIYDYTRLSTTEAKEAAARIQGALFLIFLLLALLFGNAY
jgi:hypothetical protein